MSHPERSDILIDHFEMRFIWPAKSFSDLTEFGRFLKRPELRDLGIAGPHIYVTDEGFVVQTETDAPQHLFHEVMRNFSDESRRPAAAQIRLVFLNGEWQPIEA